MNLSPTQTPLPVVVSDVRRDWTDWVMFGVGIGGVLVGAIAIVYAVLAYQHAHDVEQRSRKMVAAERRRVFELEVLRDLLDIIDRSFDFRTEEFNAGMEAWTRLSLFPGELPFWNFYARSDQDEVMARLDADGVPVSQALLKPIVQTFWRIRWALLRDVTDAIERRIKAKL